NGLRAVGGGTDGTYQEYFMKGTVPSGTCDVPKPPEDTDKDGVFDPEDVCADTPAGTEVDVSGCPVEVEEEEDDVPVVTDTDGDGVANANDKCANTPLGTTVDATGCPVASGGNGGGSGGGNGGGGTTTPIQPRPGAAR